MRKDRYLFDSVLMSHFGMFPPGLDISNLHEVQKDFILYLLAGGTTRETLSSMVSYREQKRSIEEKDFYKEVMAATNPHILSSQAALQGITTGELVQKKAKELQEKALHKLHTEYYGDSTPKKQSDSIIAEHTRLARQAALERASTLIHKPGEKEEQSNE